MNGWRGKNNLKKIGINMYIDKDRSEKISIMELSREDTRDIGVILLEFERLIGGANISDGDKARLSMLSAKIRFQIIDVLK